MPRDTVRVKFSGKSQAKGRNNYFALDSGDAHDHSEIDQQYPILIDLWSKRTGGAPPIRLMLTEEDLDNLYLLISSIMVDWKAYRNNTVARDRLFNDFVQRIKELQPNA